MVHEFPWCYIKKGLQYKAADSRHPFSDTLAQNVHENSLQQSDIRLDDRQSLRYWNRMSANTLGILGI